jgi:hypothetical protein
MWLDCGNPGTGGIYGGRGMGSFRRFAEECRRLVSQVVAVEDKAILLDMAQVWIHLADSEREIEALLNEDAV